MKSVLILFIGILFIFHSDVLHAQTYDPSHSPDVDFRTWNYNRSVVEIRDSDFYERMDLIAQRDFEVKLELFQKGIEFFEKGDFESALYYFKRTNFNSRYQNELYQDRLLLMFISSVEGKESRNSYSINYRKVKSNCDGTRLRVADKLVKDRGLKIRNFSESDVIFFTVMGGIVVVTVLAVLVISL